ncbi:putative subtilase-type serine protease precursor [Gemmata sp. SH-PL17]|uniref:PPC domain-containing protein n=1 Tax=Gemmata sp. SH-PL17 TaxID=1630693 RepID=UPI00078DDC4E|nr:PPC domain-containing protein [Gemmata sp. SH-PL17]AMV23400.1 putative subtilase-type serine protease precursor [Gemmata sp. SH-PL17]
MYRVFCLVVISLAVGSLASSQDKKQPDAKKEPAPKVLYAIPLVAKPGEKQKLVLRGKNLAAVKEVKVAGAEGAKVKVLGAKAVGVPNNYPGERVGDSEIDLDLDLPKDVKPGAVKLTAVNGGGDSNAYTLLVRDDLPAVAEKEDNDGFDTAQALPVPCAVEGTIKGEKDVDVFKFEGKKGTKVRIEVQAARFGSPVDGFLTLYDADHKVIDSADDVNGSSDPILTVTLPKDGAYFVALIDAHDLGGANFGYRLVVKAE